MIVDTIFSPSFGNRPSYLVGRESVLSQLMQGLQLRPGSRERATVMLGQRGSGKTVLLWEIAERAEQLGFVVATPTISSEGMLERIVEKIQDAGERYVPRAGVHVSGGSLGALGFSVGLQFSQAVQESKSFEYKLTQLARALSAQGRGILILVDELQANSPEIRQLVIAYQELVGEGLDVAIVLAGLPGAVSATLNDKVLTFLNRAQKLRLPPLSSSDIDGFYAWAFKQLGVHLDADDRHEAVSETQGSPYLLQLIGHAIVLWADESGNLSRENMTSAIEGARRDFENDVCGTTLSALSERDVGFLSAMAMDGGASKVADVAERMGVTYDYAQKYRKRLIDAGVIEAASWGSVAFAVPLLADYLRRQQ